MGSRIHQLSRGRTIVGRSKTAHVEIEEIFAARSHCVMDWDDHLGRHLLSVWGINGVSVNGTMVHAGTEPRPLFAGDELRIGGASLLYVEAIGGASG
jgi:pSer/pThr/pTyr-binding forkhead associated (FHA) protein